MLYCNGRRNSAIRSSSRLLWIIVRHWSFQHQHPRQYCAISNCLSSGVSLLCSILMSASGDASTIWPRQHGERSRSLVSATDTQMMRNSSSSAGSLMDWLSYLLMTCQQAWNTSCKTHQKAPRSSQTTSTTYVMGSYRQVQPAHGQIGVHFQRVPPRFPHELWNVHNATLNNEPRTNNQCEGWNNRLFHLVRYMHPSIWTLIDAIQKADCKVTTLIAQDLIGQPPRKRVRREYKESPDSPPTSARIVWLVARQ